MKILSMGNEEEIFVKKETTEGTLVYPTATDLVLAMGVSTIGQEPELIDDEQLRGMRSRLSPIKGRINIGEWSFITYVKPAGVLGTPPESDVLHECLFGTKQVNAGVSVVYGLDSTSNLPSFSLWVKKGHTVFGAEGVTVNQGEFNIVGNEIGQISWSGQFMRWYKAGEALLTAGVNNGATVCTVDRAERFSDSKIKIIIGDDNNSDNGYTITSINYDTNVITFTPGLAGAGETSGESVTPWWPTTGTEVGRPVHGKLGICTLDGIDTKVLSAVITFVNNIKYYEDEKNGLLYPTTYEAVGFRDITGVLQLYYYKGAAGYFYRSEEQTKDALIVPCGDAAGKIMELSCPQIEYKPPALSGDEEVIMDLPFGALGTVVGDDEFSCTYK